MIKYISFEQPKSPGLRP